MYYVDFSQYEDAEKADLDAVYVVMSVFYLYLYVYLYLYLYHVLYRRC